MSCRWLAIAATTEAQVAGMLSAARHVEAAIGQIEQAGLDDIVLVAHSMAGLAVPGAATRLGRTGCAFDVGHCLSETRLKY